MPFASSEQIPLAEIRILRDERQRREIKTEDLELSIARVGLIHAIVVRRRDDGTPELVAGERRLEACRKLGWQNVPVRWLDSLNPIELQIIEHEENIKREDFGWKEIVLGVARIHELYLQLDPDWTIGETTDALSYSKGIVSMYLRVANALREGNAKVVIAGTVREAYGVLTNADQRASANALQDLLNAPPPTQAPIPEAQVLTAQAASLAPVVKLAPIKIPEPILNISFLDWAPAYTGEKFNLLHCDFPYGLNVFRARDTRAFSASARGDSYNDSPDLYFALLECLCKNLDRVMSSSGHIIFWYSTQHYLQTMKTFRALAPSLEFARHPLVWGKSDNVGVTPDPRRMPRHIYETALFGMRGRRPLLKVKGDWKEAPTDKRLHVSCKPEPVLRFFFEMIVDENTSLLDPTCGSGSALRAAESLGATRVLGLEVDEEHCENARIALRNSRLLRGASAIAMGK